jgi:hypothetical protein
MSIGMGRIVSYSEIGATQQMSRQAAVPMDVYRSDSQNQTCDHT